MNLKRIWRNNAGFIIVGALAVVMLLLAFIIVKEERRLIQDCVATTAHDYYVCRALVKAGSPRPPVIINPGRF